MEITVKPNDTLTSLAKANNTTAQAIADASGIGLNSILNLGQKLTVSDAQGQPADSTEELINKAIEITKPEAAEDKTPGLGNLQLQEKREEAKYITRQGSKSTEAEKLAAQKYLDSQGRVQPEIQPEVMPKDIASGQIAREETRVDLMDPNITLAEQSNLTEELELNPKQGPKLSTEKAEIKFESDNIILDAEPVIAEGTGGIVETSLTSTADKDSDGPPTDVVLAALIKAATPQERKASDVYTQVIKALGDQDFTSTVDAKELYQQLSDDVARDTKKIDDSIAAIAEEKIKPTFKGFDKFLAVLGAALGSYGSSMTGTPNFALNIINKAIDADAQQFLASQEIRTKSLLEQRQAVLQRRTDLLQLGINQADRTLKAAQGQRDNQLKIAQVQKIKDDVIAAQDKVIQTFNSGLVELYTDKIAAQKLAKTVQSKDSLERGVNPMTVKNGKGELHTVPGFFAPTAKEGADVRKIRGQTVVINGFLDKMEDLYKNENNWLPAAIDESTAKLNQYYNELKLQVKVIKNMGANFTVPEIEMIDATIPTSSIIDRAKNGLVKISNLRDIYISEQYATMESFGYTKMPTKSELQKKPDYLKTGVSK